MRSVPACASIPTNAKPRDLLSLPAQTCTPRMSAAPGLFRPWTLNFGLETLNCLSLTPNTYHL